jgi:PAS domain-containing protein
MKDEAARRERRRERRSLATRATLVYVFAGAAWILLSDILLYRLVHDPLLIARLETAKGWTFVGLSALLVFVIVSRTVARLRRAEATMRAVVESIADGVLLVGPGKSVVDANPAAVRMLGVDKREALLGMGTEELSRASTSATW